MWRRSDNICFALLLHGGEGVSVGDRAQCKVKGILQVHTQIASTRRLSSTTEYRFTCAQRIFRAAV